jgi:hypothetical protein
MQNLTIAIVLGITTTAGILIGTNPAYGVSFTGALSNADDIRSVSFTSDGSSPIAFKSYGYAGGTNAAGTVIAAGGFDPILTLFDTADNYIEEQNGAPNGSPDFNFSRTLSAGNYRAVISTFPNFFNFSANPNFIAGYPGGGDLNGQSLKYAFDIVTTNPTAVPEPFTVIGTLVGGTAVVRMRKKLGANKSRNHD